MHGKAFLFGVQNQPKIILVGIKFCIFQWISFIGVQKIVQLIVGTQRILKMHYF